MQFNVLFSVFATRCRTLPNNPSHSLIRDKPNKKQPLNLNFPSLRLYNLKWNAIEQFKIMWEDPVRPILICLYWISWLGHTQPLIQWVPGAVSLGMKLPRRETDHSPPSSDKLKSVGAMAALPHVSSLFTVYYFLKGLRKPSKYSVRISGPRTEFVMGPPQY
jgi:hypothetical protein